MVQILPFVGWRYDLSQVGALSEVTSPPTVLIDENLQRDLYRQHPCNAVRLVLNREEPGDTSQHDRSLRADEFWRLWKREGILLREHDPAFYIVETTFSMAGRERVRWNLIGRLQLPDPAAETAEQILSFAEPQQSRVEEEREIRALCQACFAPVTGLLSDPAGSDAEPRTLAEHLEGFTRQMTPVECLDDSGARHRIWPITNPSAHTELIQRLADFSLTIIGGAAEYQAALEVPVEDSANTPNDPRRTALVCLIAADDDGVEFLPNVFVRPAPPGFTAEQAHQRLSEAFQCQTVGNEVTAGADAVELAGLNAQQPCVALGTSDGAWMLVASKETTDLSAEILIQKISETINAGSDQSKLQHVPFPWHHGDVGRFLQTLRSRMSTEVLIVEPSHSAMILCSRSIRADHAPESMLRLHSPVPTGFVFSSIGMSAN